MDQSLIDEFRNKFESVLVNDGSYRLCPPMTGLNKIEYTYRKHKLDYHGEYNRGECYADYPTVWIPSYSYLKQELDYSNKSTIKIYDPLWDYSEEQLISEFKNTIFPDYVLIVIAHEITGGQGPSFIEIRTIAAMLNLMAVDNSPWSILHWADYMMETNGNSRGTSTIIQILDATYEECYFTFDNTKMTVKSIVPFDESVKIAPQIIEMYQKIKLGLETKMSLVDTYSKLTNLPKINLWFIIYNLDMFHEENDLEIDEEFLHKITLNMAIYCSYIVHNMKDLIKSYKEARASV